RGATTTAKALAEQSASGSQISNEASMLVAMIASVTRAMNEQAAAAQQIMAASQLMRRQSDQVAKGMSEQARAIKDMTRAGRGVSKQIALITAANREHITHASSIVKAVADTRLITERNARGAHETLRGGAILVERAQSLNAILDGLAAQRYDGKKAGKKKA